MPETQIPYAVLETPLMRWMRALTMELGFRGLPAVDYEVALSAFRRHLDPSQAAIEAQVRFDADQRVTDILDAR